MTTLVTAAVFALATIGEPLRVQDAILGVKVGTSAAEVQTKLGSLGAGESRPTRDGGSKHVWTLNATQFSSLALRLNAAGRVVWITGFARPGREVPFNELGDVTRARTVSAAAVVWHVARADGGYRLIARGSDRRANTVSLLAFGTDSENKED